MQVPVSYWGADSGEGEFVFYKGQLLAGCMDKAQFGKFGLVHAMQVRADCQPLLLGTSLWRVPPSSESIHL